MSIWVALYCFWGCNESQNNKQDGREKSTPKVATVVAETLSDSVEICQKLATNPENFANQQITLAGHVEISDYYNYEYAKKQDDVFSLSLQCGAQKDRIKL